MRTDSDQAFKLMIDTLNAVGKESGHTEGHINFDEIDEEVKELWLEVWRRMLVQFNEWNSER